MFYTIQICSFLEGNILSSSTKNTKTCSSHLHEASNKHKHPLGLMNLPFSFAHYRNVLSCPFKVKHQLFDPKASVTLKYLQQGLWLNLLFLSVSISLSIFFWSTKVRRYSLIDLCQNMLVADCAFFRDEILRW